MADTMLDPADYKLTGGPQAPLQSLYPEGSQGGSGDTSGASIANRPTVAQQAPDDGWKQKLLPVLMGLSSFGGHQTPLGLQLAYRDSLIQNRQDQADQRKQAGEQRKAERERLSGGLISEGLQAYAAGDSPGAMQKFHQLLTHTDDPPTRAKTIDIMNKVARETLRTKGIQGVNELLASVSDGVMTDQLRIAIKGAIAATPDIDPQSRKTLSDAIDLVGTTEGGFRKYRFTGGSKVIYSEPISHLVQSGNQLLRVHGVDLLGKPGDVRPGVVAEEPKYVSQGPETKLNYIPGQAQQPPEAPGTPAPITPAQGSIVPAGGMPPALTTGPTDSPATQQAVADAQAARQRVIQSGAPLPSGPQSIPAEGKKITIPQADSVLLSGSPWANATVTSELGTAGLKYLQDKKDAIAESQSNRIQGRSGALVDKRLAAKKADADKTFAAAHTMLNQIEGLLPELDKQKLLSQDESLRAGATAWARRKGAYANEALAVYRAHAGDMVAIFRKLGDLARNKDAFASAISLIENPSTTLNGMKKSFAQIRDQLRSTQDGVIRGLSSESSMGADETPSPFPVSPQQGIQRPDGTRFKRPAISPLAQ